MHKDTILLLRNNTNKYFDASDLQASRGFIQSPTHPCGLSVFASVQVSLENERA
jgi:hypothetical protein